MVTLRLERLHQGPEIVVRNAEKVAECLFTLDPSSSAEGAFDDHIASRANDPSMFSPADVTAINRTMAARSPLRVWEPLLGHRLPWLDALDPTWDLFDLTNETWPTVVGRVGEAFRALVGPGRSLAVATKILHIKRPRLIPVLDSLVQLVWAGRADASMQHERAVRTGAELMTHIRRQGTRNVEALREVQTYLAARGFERTLVRILDLLLWSLQARQWSGLEPLVAEWFGG